MSNQRMPFDPELPMVARREFTASGVKYQRGESFPAKGRTRAALRALHTAGYIDCGELRDNHERREQGKRDREARAARVALAEQAADRARIGALGDDATAEPYRPKHNVVAKKPKEAARTTG